MLILKLRKFLLILATPKKAGLSLVVGFWRRRESFNFPLFLWIQKMFPSRTLLRMSYLRYLLKRVRVSSGRHVNFRSRFSVWPKPIPTEVRSVDRWAYINALARPLALVAVSNKIRTVLALYYGITVGCGFGLKSQQWNDDVLPAAARGNSWDR